MPIPDWHGLVRIAEEKGIDPFAPVRIAGPGGLYALVDVRADRGVTVIEVEHTDEPWDWAPESKQKGKRT